MTTRHPDSEAPTVTKLKRTKPEARSRMLSFRTSATELEYLKAEAANRGLKVPDLLRAALDAYLTGRRKPR